MSGFNHKLFNKKIAESMIQDILVKILQCSEMMVADYKISGKRIRNHEEHIRNVLYNEYLNDNRIVEKIGLNKFHFEAEVPENYQNHTPIGRVDLKVINQDTFTQKDAYFIIECKRIDGGVRLNKAYVTDGINRFLSHKRNQSKYSSYYGVNCMLGFVVNRIDIDKNMTKINLIHQEINTLKKKATDINEYIFNEHFKFTYVSNYSMSNNILKLYHAFYDFSLIIKQ